MEKVSVEFSTYRSTENGRRLVAIHEIEHRGHQGNNTTETFIGPMYDSPEAANLARRTAKLWLDSGATINQVDDILYALACAL
jgi:hypothetical protein